VDEGDGWAGAWRTLASTEDDLNNKGYYLGVADDNTWRFQIAPQPYPGSWAEVTGPTVTLNDWVHVVGTYDGSTAKLYLNGVLAGSVSVSIGVNTLRPLGIGGATGDGSTWVSFTAGQIDEVALYNTAMSATQIRTHYNTGRCYKDGVLADSPLGYWRLG
jgi:Concanavalin A-like lectin/glucanases superfamily